MDFSKQKPQYLIKTLLLLVCFFVSDFSWSEASGGTEKLPDGILELPILQEINLETAVIHQIKQQQQQVEYELNQSPLSLKNLANEFELMGQVYHAYELLEAAKISYLNTLTLDKNRFTSSYLLAHLYQQQGEFQQAIDAYENAAQLNPKYVALWVNLGECLVQIKQLDKAQKAYLTAQSLNRQEPGVLAGLGKLMLIQKKYQLAIDYFSKAITQQPAATRLNYSIAMAYRGLGNENKAREFLSQSGKIGLKPLDPILEEQALLLEGERIQLLTGKKAFNMGNYTKALESFQAAFKTEPTSVRARINLSATLSQLRQYDKAQTYLIEAIELAPENTTAHYNLGQLLKFKKEYKNAIQHFKKADELSTHDISIKIELAKLQQQLGNQKEALNYYQQVVQLNPDNAAFLSEYGQLLFQQQDYTNAIASLRKANQLEPTDGLIAHDLARMLVIVPIEDLKDGDKALSLAQNVFETKPDLQHADTLIRSYIETGNCVEAKSLIQKVLQAIDLTDPGRNKLNSSYKELLANARFSECRN